MARNTTRIGSLFGRLLLGSAMPRVTPTKEMGTGGTPVRGGIVQDIERSSQWVGQQKYKTSAELAINVSIVAAGIHHFLNLVSHPGWKVSPVDDTPAAVEAAEFMEEVMYDMVTPWPRIVRRAGMYRFHGFGIQEWTAKRRPDGRIGLQDIESRPQHTIELWDVDERGTVQGVWQRSPNTFELLGLPRSKIIYLVEDTLTDSPEGLGIFRHLAEPFERLKLYLKLEARTFERDLRGIPIGKAPLTLLNKAVRDKVITEDEANAAVNLLKDFVQTQIKESDTGVVFDSVPYESQAQDGAKVSGVAQWGVELLSGTGLGLDQLAKAIDRVQREMARIIGTEHQMMGSEGTGNRALSEDKSRNLYLIVNSVLSDIGAAFDADIITPIWNLNGLPEELKPYFVVEDVAFRDVQEVTTALRDMAAAGAMLVPDDPVINDVRDMLGVSPQPELDPELIGSFRTPPDEMEEEGAEEEEDLEDDLEEEDS